MDKILYFDDFIINELHKFVSDSTSTGRTKWIDWVHDDPTTNKSHAASVLLRKKLTELEDDEIKKNMGDIPNWMIRKIKNNPGKYLKIRVTLNNLEFLKDQLKKGPLHCEYCGKGPLVVYEFMKKDLGQLLDNPDIKVSKFNSINGATCDHKQPQGKGGDRFDYSNLAVCCYRCNSKKSNVPYKDWINFLESDEGKSWITSRGVNSLKSNIPVKKSLPKSDLKVGDEVIKLGRTRKSDKYLGKILEILPNEQHPRKSLSARTEEYPNSLYDINHLRKSV